MSESVTPPGLNEGVPLADLPFEPWPSDWPEWTQQYEATARRLHAETDFEAADDIATLVSGLVQREREATRP